MEHDDGDSIFGAACGSLLVVGRYYVALSVLLLYWDVSRILHWENDVETMEYIRQLWSLAMSITLTLSWFAVLLLVVTLVCRQKTATAALGAFLLFLGAPNLLMWNIVGTVAGSFQFLTFCIKKTNCEKDVFVLAMRICTWVVLYCLSGFCWYVSFVLLRSHWRDRRLHKRVLTWRTRIMQEFGEILVHTNPDLTCTICLDGYRPGEKATLLPSCHHQFHIECLQVWLERNSTCPVCRSTVSSALGDIEL